MNKLKFSDAATYDGSLKTAISVRDGVLEYLGSEIGHEPPDKIFTVYRSPATIANLVAKMAGIPLIPDHVEPGSESGDYKSKVESATLIDSFDDELGSTLAIKNKLSLDPAMIAEIEGGKSQLSLGYTGQLAPHSKYDFEQIDLTPTHLAAVEAGRCGEGCRFMDRKPQLTPEAQMSQKVKLHKAFCDAEGSLSLSQIVELAAGLPEAIKNVPADKLAELLPALQEVMAAATAAGVEAPGADPVVEELPVMTDEDADKLMDESADAAGGDPVKVTDSARKVLRKKFADKMAVAIGEAVKVHASVIDKARTILPETYSFADKSTAQLMRDALAVEHGSQKFADAELSVAFKLLKKSSSDYQTFGDRKADENDLDARLLKSFGGK
jgi:hypothetical protein